VLPYIETPIQPISGHFLEKAGVNLLIKREDLNHPFVSGNKWWKLKYNLEEAKQSGKQKILTFGGAYSNHIYATAAAARASGFESVGIIRGDKHLSLNPTLKFAERQGMHLHYVSREEYRRKSEPGFDEELKKRFGEFYLIPEGGTNSNAIKGCAELAEKLVGIPFDCLCLPVGTGGTLSGLVTRLAPKKIIGFSVLKNGGFLKEEVRKLLLDYSGVDGHRWDIETHYDFGGYAKFSPRLLHFIQSFHQDHSIPLDPVYTGKMMYGIIDLIKQNKFERGTTIMAIHTGGLQGASH
jgi:1-aminocyclopropane-1-carboxylate deaminase/D-cysteine desulfhydrase-like pyridoxal-dependent ACC family enzyme